MKALLVLKDGTLFEGRSFGYDGEGAGFLATGEVVFNTSMSGYQEILTDPSYKWQIVCMTYPEIGNYGVNREDVESWRPEVAGFIVKNYNPRPSNFRSGQSLSDYLKENKIPGIEGIDTRALVKHLRDKGAKPGILAIGDFDPKKLIKEARGLPTMDGKDLVKEVTCEKPYQWNEGTWHLPSSPLPFVRGGLGRGRTAQDVLSVEPLPPPNPLLTKEGGKKLRVVAYDFGVKRNILRNLVHSGFDVTVVPASTPPKKVLDLSPDGIFLSNGPGDPAAVSYAIENVAQLLGKIPVFGICLGHQIMGLALGGKTYKLKFGHRGGNQPVKDLTTDKVEITAQNHGFAVDEGSLKGTAQVTHVNLNDKTVEGLANPQKKFFSVQYHPEASPGPHDSLYLFERFRKMIVEQ